MSAFNSRMRQNISLRRFVAMLFCLAEDQKWNKPLERFATCLCKQSCAHEWIANATLHHIGTVSLALVQCKFHAGNWIVAAGVKSINRDEDVDFRFPGNFWFLVPIFGGQQMPMFDPPATSMAGTCGDWGRFSPTKYFKNPWFQVKRGDSLESWIWYKFLRNDFIDLFTPKPHFQVFRPVVLSTKNEKNWNYL